MSFIPKFIKWLTQPDVSQHSIVVTARESQENGNAANIPDAINPDISPKWLRQEGIYHLREAGLCGLFTTVSGVLYVSLSRDAAKLDAAANVTLKDQAQQECGPASSPECIEATHASLLQTSHCTGYTNHMIANVMGTCGVIAAFATAVLAIKARESFKNAAIFEAISKGNKELEEFDLFRGASPS